MDISLLLGTIAFKQGFKTVVSLLLEHSPYILGAATSFAISIMASMGNRALWIALIFITIINYKTLPIAFPNFPKQTKQLLAVILLTLTTSFLAGLCYWQNIISSQQRIMLKELIASDSPCIFVDLTSPQQIPWWTMAIPRQYCYDSNMAILTISSYANKTTHAVFAPARFKDLDFEQWDKIPGDNPFRGQYPLLCTTDSLISQVKLTVGKPLPAMSPIDRFWRQYQVEKPRNAQSKHTHIRRLTLKVIASTFICLKAQDAQSQSRDTKNRCCQITMHHEKTFQIIIYSYHNFANRHCDCCLSMAI